MFCLPYLVLLNFGAMVQTCEVCRSTNGTTATDTHTGDPLYCLSHLLSYNTGTTQTPLQRTQCF